MKKIYLHTSQIPGFIEYMLLNRRHVSVVKSMAEDKRHNLFSDLRRLPEKSHFWEQWRYLTEAFMVAEEKASGSVTVEAWRCPHWCFLYNVDDPTVTAVPLCEHCGKDVHWDEAGVIVFDPKEATE